MMKTGQGEVDMSSFIDASMKLVLEMIAKSSLLAGYYTKACGRNTITSKDLDYCMKYSAKAFQTNPDFLEQFDMDDDDEEDDIETVDEDEEPFTRYRGNETLFNNINQAYDTWDQWKPDTPLQKKFKDAVDQVKA